MCPKTNKLFCFICLVMGGNRSAWTQEGLARALSRDLHGRVDFPLGLRVHPGSGPRGCLQLDAAGAPVLEVFAVHFSIAIFADSTAHWSTAFSSVESMTPTRRNSWMPGSISDARRVAPVCVVEASHSETKI
ncbi:hypothetical protein NQ318_018241, partial [Aromia moschata]